MRSAPCIKLFIKGNGFKIIIDQFLTSSIQNQSTISVDRIHFNDSIWIVWRIPIDQNRIRINYFEIWRRLFTWCFNSRFYFQYFSMESKMKQAYILNIQMDFSIQDYLCLVHINYILTPQLTICIHIVLIFGHIPDLNFQLRCKHMTNIFQTKSLNLSTKISNS